MKRFGFPETFVGWLRSLYRGQSSELVVNGGVTRRFRVTRGVRQGCPLSPLLFVLSLEPFLRTVQQCPKITGFPVPGTGSVKVSAYADDVVLFLRDSGSISQVIALFDVYTELSGAKLNLRKSEALSVGGYREALPSGIQYSHKVKILGVEFLTEGVSRGNWSAVRESITEDIKIAAQYHLSYRERAHLIRTRFYGKIWYLAHVSLPPAMFVLQINKLVTNFHWGEKKHKVPHSVLRWPREKGGWSIPCISTSCKLLALRSTMAILDEVDAPARSLVMYWLGPERRTLVPRGLGNMFPAAEIPPKFYKDLVRQFRATVAAQPQVDVRQAQVSRVCEALCYASSQSGSARFPYHFQALKITQHLTLDGVEDLLWEAGWRVLPTKDRLQRWGLTDNSSCPNCDNLETNDHVFYECVAARTFWSLVSRRYSFRAPHRARNNFEHLVVAVALYVMWRFRCRAVVQGRRIRQMFPRMYMLGRLLTQNLQVSLFIIGEAEFLRHWGHRFIRVGNGRVSLVPTQT